MAYGHFPEHPDDSVGGWMITLLLCWIPLLGFVYLLVLALSSASSPSKRNFARAVFIWQIIGVVVTIIVLVVFGASIWAALESVRY